MISRTAAQILEELGSKQVTNCHLLTIVHICRGDHSCAEAAGIQAPHTMAIRQQQRQKSNFHSSNWDIDSHFKMFCFDLLAYKSRIITSRALTARKYFYSLTISLFC